jgi:hypothetical protein
VFGRGEKVKRKNIYKELGMPRNLSEILLLLKSEEEEENEEYEDIEYEYIQLVFPPDSKPPARNSRNINLLDFSQVHNNIC